MEERAAWLAWSQIPGIGPVLLQRLQAHWGNLSEPWQVDLAHLKQVEGIGPRLLDAIAHHRRQIHPVPFLEKHSQQNPQFWTPADPDYPRLLREIPDPPPVLYYRGNAHLLTAATQNSSIAIVGTRDPSDYAKHWTRKLSHTLAKHQFTVISGMAEGIDTQAHLGCLEAQGETVAVLGTGTDIAYPPRNQGLHQQLIKVGLVISEYPAGTRPNRSHFPRRNRLIAALSRATLVMEAPRRSGALITAYLANDYGRDVYTLPHTLDNERGAGGLSLLAKGAQLILGEQHLLELLGAIPVLDAPLPAGESNGAGPSLSADLEPIWQCLQMLCAKSAQGSVSFDRLVQTSQKAAPEVSSALLQLELLGLITQRPGLQYAIARSS